ncbi:hypothetical protein FHW36_105390 [Chitinophaga polysaccharea]|uniref:Uncharacterized protein n=1 Tax=Chitinophaga polysaccharea TaxID=1293035 RepID=A0A561PPB3_9BACT|nr:hypothetical protein [Chitinophaga polysaccharea]TWF39949.1 hypothetical protein FHW36_105390 [Chitinophaga polysaccharea]
MELVFRRQLEKIVSLTDSKYEYVLAFLEKRPEELYFEIVFE